MDQTPQETPTVEPSPPQAKFIWRQFLDGLRRQELRTMTEWAEHLGIRDSARLYGDLNYIRRKLGESYGTDPETKFIILETPEMKKSRESRAHQVNAGKAKAEEARAKLFSKKEPVSEQSDDVRQILKAINVAIGIRQGRDAKFNPMAALSAVLVEIMVN